MKPKLYHGVPRSKFWGPTAAKQETEERRLKIERLAVVMCGMAGVDPHTCRISASWGAWKGVRPMWMTYASRARKQLRDLGWPDDTPLSGE